MHQKRLGTTALDCEIFFLSENTLQCLYQELSSRS